MLLVFPIPGTRRGPPRANSRRATRSAAAGDDGAVVRGARGARGAGARGARGARARVAAACDHAGVGGAGEVPRVVLVTRTS